MVFEGHDVMSVARNALSIFTDRKHVLTKIHTFFFGERLGLGNLESNSKSSFICFYFYLFFFLFFLLLFFLLYLVSIHLTVTQQFLWLPSFIQNSCLMLKGKYHGVFNLFC